MTINVYWACNEDEWLRAESPVSIKKLNFSLNAFKSTNAVMCPATRDFLHNYYGLKSIYEYECSLQDDILFTSNLYDQQFFDKHVLIRDIRSKSLSFKNEYVFFTDSDSLIMSEEQPFLEENYINQNCIIYPGQFDIGKWFRPIEFAFRLRKDINDFKIMENEIYCYVKFHTIKDINFIQFRMSNLLKSFAVDVLSAKFRQNKSKFRNLLYRYKSFSTKKLILQEIKKNILT